MNGEATKARGLSVFFDSNRNPPESEPAPQESIRQASQPASETVKTAEAAYRIAAILEDVNPRQIENVFRFVQAIRQTAAGESVQELADRLSRIAQERRQREINGNEKRGWFHR